MKRLVFFLLPIALAACRPASAKVLPSPAFTQPPTAEPIATQLPPVYVPAMCTLMGRAVRSEVPARHPVIVMWGWSAATEEQVREYIRVSKVIVTFDGVEISGQQQSGIPYNDTSKRYAAVWISNVGIPKLGIHTITYLLTFSEKLFDGFVYYGPGTDKEKQEDKCEIDVK